VRIEFGDNGTGVEPHVKDSLFKERVSTLKTGWGIGLAEIHRTIVENFRGTISEIDQTGGGAKFRIDLRKSSAFAQIRE